MGVCTENKKYIYAALRYTGFNMDITYDKEADAMYIEFQKGKFAKNKKIDEETIIDLDKDGNLLGIELLDVSKRIPLESLSEVNVKNLLTIAH